MNKLIYIIQHKAYRLLLLAILLFFVGIKLSFIPTWDEWLINDKLGEKEKLINDVSYDPGYQIRKNIELTKAIARYEVDSTTWYSRSMQTIGLLAEKDNVHIIDIPARPAAKTDSSGFSVRSLTLEGDFKALTRIYHQLSIEKGIGVIRSGTYEMIGNQSSDGKKRLQLTLHMIWLDDKKRSSSPSNR